MYRLLFTLALCSACFATSLGPRFYITQPTRVFADSTSLPVIAHVDEKLLMQLNAILLYGRRVKLEQAACLRIDKRHADSVWVDSLFQPTIDRTATTEIQVVFACDAGTVPIHWHVVYERDGWDQCGPSPYDVAPDFAKYPAEMIQCGI